jgi:flagellar biosynthesis GTPase FlhF
MQKNTSDQAQYTRKANQNKINSELDDLLQRSGTLNRSEQRRLMAECRKGYENSPVSNANDALQSIIKEYPRIKDIPTIKRYTQKNITSDSIIYNEQPSDGIDTSINRRSKRISKNKCIDKEMRGFIVPDKIKRNANEYTLSDSGDSGDSDDSGDSGDSGDSEYSGDSGVIEELNDLLDEEPMARKRKRVVNSADEVSNKEFNSKLKDIRESYNQNKVDMTKVIEAKFNDEDGAWFYSRLGRIKGMEACKDKYDIEDEIQRKFDTLSSLQSANLYDKFNRPIERNVIKEIIDSRKSNEIKQIMINRMTSVHNNGSEEYHKSLAWLDVALSIPTDSEGGISKDSTGIGLILHNLKKNLDSHLFGMDNVKRQILQAVATIHGDPDSGYIIALVGDPGVGKTTISSLIAESIGMGFGQVSCGSIKDHAVIMGHSSTYVGAKPGVFTQILINNNDVRNVILLDEMDKLHDNSILPSLLQILDKTQNSRFKDAFCPEFDIDMSKNLYMIAVNDINVFDKALRDRLKIIEVSGYDIEEKTDICCNYIIPKIKKTTGILPSIDRNTVKYFVNKISPNKSGVRDVMRYFEDIYEKLDMIRRVTEYLKSVNIIEDDSISRPAKRVKRHPVLKKSDTSPEIADMDVDPDLTESNKYIAQNFRSILKTHLYIDIPPTVDLRNINSLKFLDISLIEALE